MSESQTVVLQRCIDRLRAGDSSAKNDLLDKARDRLLRLAHMMLKPSVARWEQDEDVVQNAYIRLSRALDESPPESVKHFLNLAALQIRRELTDLARHYYGALGQGRHHHTDNVPSADPLADAGQTTSEPSKLAQWAQFHEQIKSFSGDEQEIINLLWYNDMPQPEAAALLNIPVRTLQRRWASIKVKMHDAMKGSLPE